MAPQVSIILPTFNGEKFIAEAIKSCLVQSFIDFELIVVNDCSTDNTLSIVQSFAEKDSRIRIVNNPRNMKLPASLNIGFQNARGKYYTWTSDDNTYESNALNVLFDSISENNSPDIVYSAYNIVDEQNSFSSTFGGFPEQIVFQNIIGACFLFKKNVFERLSGYDETKYMVEDYDFWLRALKYFDFKYVNNVLYTYRRHEKSISNKIYKNQNVYNEFVELHKKIFSDFYSDALGVSFSSEEIVTLTNIYLNKYLKNNFELTLEHYKNCTNLFTKLENIDWEKINFNKNRMSNVLNTKKEVITETYIQELFYWKSQVSETKFCFRKKYVTPAFWFKKIKFLITANKNQ